LEKNDFRKDVVFSELATLSKKKALIENKLMDLYYEELNLCSNPSDFDFFPKEQVSSPFNQNPQQVVSGERTIGNIVFCFPKKQINENIDASLLKEIKLKKVNLLKKLNLLSQQLDILERKHNTFQKTIVFPFGGD
jgi:hypothetical protein